MTLWSRWAVLLLSKCLGGIIEWPDHAISIHRIQLIQASGIQLCNGTCISQMRHCLGFHTAVLVIVWNTPSPVTCVKSIQRRPLWSRVSSHHPLYVNCHCVTHRLWSCVQVSYWYHQLWRTVSCQSYRCCCCSVVLCWCLLTAGAVPASIVLLLIHYHDTYLQTMHVAGENRHVQEMACWTQSVTFAN